LVTLSLHWPGAHELILQRWIVPPGSFLIRVGSVVSPSTAPPQNRSLNDADCSAQYRMLMTTAKASGRASVPSAEPVDVVKE
jgi:hypothetical protein